MATIQKFSCYWCGIMDEPCRHQRPGRVAAPMRVSERVTLERDTEISKLPTDAYNGVPIGYASSDLRRGDVMVFDILSRTIRRYAP